MSDVATSAATPAQPLRLVLNVASRVVPDPVQPVRAQGRGDAPSVVLGRARCQFLGFAIYIEAFDDAGCNRRVPEENAETYRSPHTGRCIGKEFVPPASMRSRRRPARSRSSPGFLWYVAGIAPRRDVPDYGRTTSRLERLFGSACDPAIPARPSLGLRP